MNSIMLSVQPKWLAKILNGEKTIEIRKSIPKDLPTPFVMYLYCTKESGLEYADNPNPNEKGMWVYKKGNPSPFGGKVVAKCVVDGIGYDYGYHFPQDTLDELCLTRKELIKYLGAENCIGYTYYITQLEIFDKPRELSEFHKVGFNEAMKNWEWDRLSPPDEKSILIPCPAPRYEIKKAPQSWCYVEEKQDE